MATSVYWSILQSIQATVAGLALVDWSNVVVPVAIRKISKGEEALDTLPLIAVVPQDRPPKRKTLAFGAGNVAVFRTAYLVEVAFVAAGNRDFTSAHLDVYMSWHESVTNAFKTPGSIVVTSVMDVNVMPDLITDRKEMDDSYDIGGLTIEAISVA